MYGYIGAKNMNFEVMKHVGELLDRFSIHHNLKVKERKRDCKPYLMLFINRGGDVKRFHGLVGFSIGRRARKLDKLIQIRDRQGEFR